LWDLLEEFQEVFTSHKGKLGQCYVGKHFIDTQGLPPHCMTLKQLFYWEETELNQQINIGGFGEHV